MSDINKAVENDKKVWYANQLEVTNEPFPSFSKEDKMIIASYSSDKQTDALQKISNYSLLQPMLLR